MSKEFREDVAQVAHTMIFEDAAWASDVLLSARTAPGARFSGLLLPLLVGHWARIVYEGSETLRTGAPGVAMPHLAEQLMNDHAATLARARHSTKLFDDTKRTYEQVLLDVGAYREAHIARFTGNTHWLLRRFECDLGLTLLGRSVVGTTVGSHIHLGQPPPAIGDEMAMSQAAHSAAVEQGAALRVMLALRDEAEPQATLDLRPLWRMRTRDKDSERYLSGRYDHRYPIALKLVLLGIEADLTTCELVLPVLEPGHADATFRTRVVMVFHALNALREISSRYAPQAGRTSALGEVLQDPSVRRLSARAAREVRNRCVHYEVRGRLREQLRPGHRMQGIVEAATEGPFADFDDDVRTATGLIIEGLRTWRAQPTP